MIRVDVLFHEKEDESIIASLGGIITDPLGFIPNLFIADIPEDKLEELRSNPLVKSVDVEQWVRANSISQAQPEYDPYIYDKLFLRLKDYWDRGLTGKGMKVGIIDAAGVNHYHLPVKDGVWYDGSIVSLTDSHDPHSTSCAGIMCGRPTWMWDGSITRNVSGVAYDADLYVAIAGAHGQGNAVNTSYAVSALNWLIGKKVDVVSCSWGGGSYSSSFETALNAAYNSGIAVVCAVGNSGGATVTEQGEFPSNLANAISVGACDDKKTRWLDPTNTQGSGTGSSTSASIMFTAPGYRVLTYWADTDPNVRGENSTWFTGTSGAAPLIAGLIALYKQALPNKTLPQILSIMQNSCWTFGKTGRNMEYGYGMPLPSPEILSKPLVVSKGLKMEHHTTYINPPSSPLLNSLVDNFTIECTVTMTSGSGGNLIRKYDNTNATVIWGIYLDSYVQAIYSIDNAGTPAYYYYYYNYNSAQLKNVPQTWTLVFNYPNLYLYRNGEQVATTDMGGHMVTGSNNPLYQIGRYLRGVFHSARIYNRSLSAGEVKSTVNGTRISNGLILEYIAQGNETTQILDTSGNNLHGTIYGGMTPTVKKI